MSLWSLSFKYLLRRWGGALLTVIVGALGIALIGTVMNLAEDVPSAVKKALGGADMVVGPKGSELDLVMCCALHITPTRGLVSYRAAAEAVKNPYVKASAPVALGDSYNGTRILWTTPAIVGIYDAKLAQGRMWSGGMEAVVGAGAARSQHLTIGSKMISTHGLDIGGELHRNAAYTVVGILKPNGSVIDRLILADLKSIRVVHVDIDDPDEQGPTQVAGQGYDKDGMPIAISAMVAKFSSPIAAAITPRQISTTTDLTAANPELEMARLSALVRPVFNIMVLFGVLFGIVAACMAAISLVSGLNQRARDLALLRILGASRFKVARMAFQESLILVHGAFLLGIAVMAGLGSLVADRMLSYGLLISNWPSLRELLLIYVGTLVLALLASIIPVVRVAASSVEEGLKA
ncbi:hypothetical protein MMA231_03615 (plasmid) [Asticcacaulis sp. MM231]|uniref:ABC transporter permease n=1 Tax=Asticcacaulis sp. MM231 TaxID=3157666 RepID=UPI0032D5674C